MPKSNAQKRLANRLKQKRYIKRQADKGLHLKVFYIRESWVKDFKALRARLMKKDKQL